jgi:hypothetical protein
VSEKRRPGRPRLPAGKKASEGKRPILMRWDDATYAAIQERGGPDWIRQLVMREVGESDRHRLET